MGESKETGGYCRNRMREDDLEQSARKQMVRSGLIVDRFESKALGIF